jgi:type IV secretory pathway VirB3-like protein
MNAPWDAIAWWEMRRIPFNIVVGLTGAVGGALLLGIGSLLVKPGEDVIEPMAIFVAVPLYAVAANVCYTLGWASELLWTWGDTSKTAHLRARIFWLGLALSVAVTLLPVALVLAAWAIFGFR